ncbi:hypothetical protein [Sulfolobus spindle-shaped virus]|nr:hypothetical protein [Sulfolobus spindle-shaped virus]AZG03327.1 hypothetical protein [Sulfolobus spindle-shaped virus]
MSETKFSTRIEFRISVLAKEKYLKLDARKKRIVKLALESLIFSLSDDKENFEKVAKELGIELVKDNITPSINININYNENKPKAEAKVNVTIDLSDLINKLNELWNEVKVRNKDIQRNNAIVLPPARIKEFDELIAKIMKKLVN